MTKEEKNFGREGREKGVKRKGKQPRRISQPIYLVRDALIKQQ
jgi:hypothetical protein